MSDGKPREPGDDRGGRANGARLGRVFLVGGGPGDPGLISVRGLEALRSADVVVYDRLAGDRLLAEAPAAAERIYAGKETDSHTLAQSKINDLLIAKARQGYRVVRLKGGDPFVFGRGGEEAEALARAGIPFEVVPGVTSAIAAPAYAGIPVTQRGIAASFVVVTGREEASKSEPTVDWGKLAAGFDTIVCLMGIKNLPTIVEELLRHGRSPETPVALIRWGTWPTQETLVGTLADIVDLAHARRFTPPAVTVIGEVVRLRESLKWFETRPLFGRRVLVTRAEAQAAALSSRLSEAGALPVEVPIIRIEPPDSWGPVDEAISRLGEYDWVVFTSANGVRAFFGRLERHGKDGRALGGRRIAAIGPATAAALREHGLRADLVPAAYVAESLVGEFAGLDLRGARVLLARAAEARDVLSAGLAAQGATVDTVAVYRTVRVEEARARLADLLDAGGLDAVTFASSSSVRYFADAVDGDAAARLAGVVVACIGPITAATAAELGIRVDVVAEKYTVPGLVRALEGYFRGLPDR